MIIFNKSISSMQNYVMWIRKALLYILRLTMIIKTLQMMFKKHLVHQIMEWRDHYH